MLSADAALAYMAEGAHPSSFSAFGDEPALVLDLASCQHREQSEQLAAWLPGLACPVIGVRNPDVSSCAHPLESICARACDVVVDEVEAVQPLLDTIQANPLAAASFVDLLRVTENLPALQALSVESAVYAALQGGREYAVWLERQAARRPAEPEEGPAVLPQREGDVLTLTLNRPKNSNAMSVEMRDALVESLRAVAADDGIKRLELRGAGACFSTGGDLREFGSVPDSASGHVIRMLSVPGKFLLPVAQRAHVHVHGSCIGSGIEFPAFAGRVTAAADAWFCLPEVGMGLIPGAGGCISIARRIGRQRLAWMGLSGARVSVEVALAWGLVDEVV